MYIASRGHGYLAMELSDSIPDTKDGGADEHSTVSNLGEWPNIGIFPDIIPILGPLQQDTSIHQCVCRGPRAIVQHTQIVNLYSVPKTLSPGWPLAESQNSQPDQVR